MSTQFVLRVLRLNIISVCVSKDISKWDQHLNRWTQQTINPTVGGQQPVHLNRTEGVKKRILPLPACLPAWGDTLVLSVLSLAFVLVFVPPAPLVFCSEITLQRFLNIQLADGFLPSIINRMIVWANSSK